MFHANKIKAAVLYETGHGNKKRLLNITELSQHYVNKCDALLGLHAFTAFLSLIDILDTTSNEESDEDSDEVVSDGEEVTNMLDDSDDSDT